MSDTSAYRIPSTSDTEFDLFDSPNPTGSPERRLLLAVLERAILDYVGNDRREIEEAETWLFGDVENKEGRPFSFHWVCEQLDLDVIKVSTEIRQMPKRGARRVAPWYFSKKDMPAH
jgi:hypothetical protein